jgi:hypothetical protein
MNDRDDASFDLPRPLRGALRDLHRGPAVPPELDERILFTARDAFARRVRTRMILRRGASVGGAVAAAVAVFFGVQAVRTTTTQPEQSPVAVHTPSPAEGDVDGNGRVDIVDALALARKVEAGDVAALSWEDLDQDGKVTRADVEQLAQVAVMLPDGDVTAGGNFQ